MLLRLIGKSPLSLKRSQKDFFAVFDADPVAANSFFRYARIKRYIFISIRWFRRRNKTAKTDGPIVLDIWRLYFLPIFIFFSFWFSFLLFYSFQGSMNSQNTSTNRTAPAPCWAFAGSIPLGVFQQQLPPFLFLHLFWRQVFVLVCQQE